MKHTLFHAGQAFRLDHAIPHTHALLGRRADHVERPAALEKSPPERTLDEVEAVATHARLRTSGFYALGVLAWAESEEHAVTLAERFPAPDWVELSVVPVSAHA